MVFAIDRSGCIEKAHKTYFYDIDCYYTQRSLKISMTKRNRVCCILEGQTQPS